MTKEKEKEILLALSQVQLRNYLFIYYFSMKFNLSSCANQEINGFYLTFRFSDEFSSGIKNLIPNRIPIPIRAM